jgi:hypothetical protein
VVTVLQIGLLVLAGAAAAGAGGALVAWSLAGRSYDQGYRTGLVDRRPDPAHTTTTRAFRLPRRTR